MKKNRIIELISKRIVILDGATGTQLQKRGMPTGVCPESWCIKNPKVIEAVHKDYIEAGSNIIYSCTFGANRIKLGEYKIKDAVGINKKLASIAVKAAGRRAFVAGDIGPTGEFIKPFGPLEFEEAVDIFKQQVKGLLAGGVDLFVIETMMDIQEARAALIAVKELTDKPVFVTMTYEKTGRTLNGNDPLSCLVTLQSLGADAVGCNCSTGPKQMAKIIAAMKPYATVPLLAKPNAGIPKMRGGDTVFTMSPNDFGKWSRALVDAGVNIVGGCCGTTPEHIVQLSKSVLKRKPKFPVRKSIPAISCARGSLLLDRKKFSVIGEKINPTGKKLLKEELLQEKYGMVRSFAREQEADGAKLLDVNVGVPSIDEKKAMIDVISTLAVSSDLPLVIDSSKMDVIEEALRFYPGRALINSISGEKHKLPDLLKLAKKYGAMFILLPLAGRTVPKTFKERKIIIEDIYKLASKIGFTKDDIVVDGLVLTISTNSNTAIEIAKTVRWVSKVFKANTVVGLSNISFGLPQRHIVNKGFITMLKSHGLTMAIADPVDNKSVKTKLIVDLLEDRPQATNKFIKKYSSANLKCSVKVEKKLSGKQKVFNAIIDGNKDEIRLFVQELYDRGTLASQIIQGIMIPAIIEVGNLFESKKYFLPQLIASAETMEVGVAYLEPYLDVGDSLVKKGTIVMATVAGDIHDIGKNIVSLMLKNYGFEIIDLGKDVSKEKIINAIKKHSPDMVGLSALMTTTMLNMSSTIEAVRSQGLSPDFMVGGAVVSREYANSLGATYAKDGVQAVKIAQNLIKAK